MSKSKSATMTVQKKFSQMRKDMNKKLIERHAEIDLVLTAILCKEHPLLVGEPGTAKTMLLDSIMEWLGPGTKKFQLLFNKFTTPEEVFGPVSIVGLKEDKYRRITTNRLPEADLAFIDEIFKASTSILNTMLKILNERIYENGDGAHKVPLLVCVAASNEWPNNEDGQELAALFDRFLFRKQVKPISTPNNKRRLWWERDHKPIITTRITREEVERAYNEAMSLGWHEEAMVSFETIMEELSKEGIYPGDRRQYKAVNAAQAYAYLNNSEYVRSEDLEILSHVLWNDPLEQPIKVEKIVTKIANPLGSKINDRLMEAQDIISKSPPIEAVVKLKEVQKQLNSMLDNAETEQTKTKIKKAIDSISEEISTLYEKVVKS